MARQVSKFRNDRILLADSLYNITEAKYHIVGRRESELLIFETDYRLIDDSDIRILKDDGKIIKFSDSLNEYSFNRAKSTLYRKFILPKKVSDLWRFPVRILDDPFDLLLGLYQDTPLSETEKTFSFGKDFVVLPLYSTRSRDKEVPTKSGLNQWNADGRERKPGELYIPIPGELRNRYPDFFPKRSENFDLLTPTGDLLPASIAQDGGKALMTNPNDALSDWLLRKLFKLKEWELLTKEKEEELGFDSVMIYKEGPDRYRIDKAPYDSYEKYMHPENTDSLDDSVSQDE